LNQEGETAVPGLRELLAPGLRKLESDGRLTPEPGSPDSIQALQSLFVVDLEMSGPNAQMHEVLDLGGVRCALAQAFPEEESWGARVKPRHIGNASIGALKVVGYSPKEWKNAMELEAAFERFAALGRDAVIAGWGIGQDMAFLAESFHRLSRPWPFAPVALDIQPIARKILGGGEVDRFNLGHVADRLGIGRMGEHGALADAYATYDVLVKLVERGVERLDS
jgi:DNA polymerase III subunit epsilon